MHLWGLRSTPRIGGIRRQNAKAPQMLLCALQLRPQHHRRCQPRRIYRAFVRLLDSPEAKKTTHIAQDGGDITKAANSVVPSQYPTGVVEVGHKNLQAGTKDATRAETAC